LSIELFTIGFAGKNAERFFGVLKSAGVRRVLDIRLNNTSQLAGFTKKDDLRFFLREVTGIEYAHLPELAPTQEILDGFKKDKGDWALYEQRFKALMAERRIEAVLPRETADHACLLCSEPTPEHCHRRLVAEYLQKQWGDVSIEHLR
jgi:uncharacterized protein (DUF488 family)